MTARLALAVGLAVGLVATTGRGTPAGAEPPSGGVVRVEHRDPSTSPTLGPANALVTIEYFFVPSINANRTLVAYRALQRLHAKHPARIRIVFRLLKSTQIQLPIAAFEAHAQGKFFELMDALHVPRTHSSLTKDQVLELARSLDIDVPRLAGSISDGRYAEAFAANERRKERLGAASPGILFNSRLARATTDAEYEREYLAAYERARDLLDQGHAPRELSRVFDEQVRRVPPPFVAMSTPVDDDESDATEHRLATPPLELTGLPSFGKPDAKAPAPIVVLCRPNDIGCSNLMRTVRGQAEKLYTEDIRIVWAPWFDVTTREDVADLTMLGDAALCAEQLGSSPEDLSASPGWRWISKQLEQVSRLHGRRISAEILIDKVASELDIDIGRMSACRARMANTTLDWVARARRAGISQSPALVIGGRIYEGLVDESMIRRLIDAELAPGVLGERVESELDRFLFFLTGPRPIPQ